MRVFVRISCYKPKFARSRSVVKRTNAPDDFWYGDAATSALPSMHREHVITAPAKNAGQRKVRAPVKPAGGWNDRQ